MVKRVELSYPERRALIRALAPEHRWIKSDSMSLVLYDHEMTPVIEFYIDEEKANQYLKELNGQK